MLLRLLITFLILAFSPLQLKAEETEAKDLPPLMYFQISPDIQTFYQSDEKKYGYIVVQVQLKVRGQDNFDLVDQHLPLVQDALIDFFNSQSKEIIQDLAQRETLRKQATERIAKVFTDEVGNKVIEDVLFTQYIYQ